MTTPEQLDPDILRDFIMESIELVEGLDKDLVALEREPGNLDLINRIFRSFHTIKGASSFLSFKGLTDFAHAAEDALNALRKGEAQVTTEVMDLLLASTDVLRGQIDQVQNGDMPSAGPAELIRHLRQIEADASAAAGRQRPMPARKVAPPAPTPPPAPVAETTKVMEAGDRILILPESKRDLLEFMVDDLQETINFLGELIEATECLDDLARVSVQMEEVTDGLLRSVEFFQIDPLCAEIRALHAFAQALPHLAGDPLKQARWHAEAILNVMNERTQALRESKVLSISTAELIERLSRNLVGQALEQAADMAELSVGLNDFNPAPATPAANEAPALAPEADSAQPEVSLADQAAERAAAESRKNSAEQTIRVDVERLESLLNLVGELVLQKNRVMAFSRRLSLVMNDHEMEESFTQIASDLDRVTSDLQLGVMKTRMQPLSKIFNRYPRVIRDLAHATGKEIELKIFGGETEVDKSVIELLGDPLVHIIRNSCDHGIEPPEERLAAGKPAQGVVALSAGYEGNHVLVEITDDGRGLDPAKLGQRAIERGLVTAEELAVMPEANILRFIFVPGFSTAKKVSNISGRGVGMDVVQTNINKLNGMVDVFSRVGQGTTVALRIPLTVAIMQAMMVKVQAEIYAIPLSHILEIVRPEPQQVVSINGRPVLRLRNEVLPVIDLAEVLGQHKGEAAEYAVIVGLGEERIGLLVHRLVGQEEIVIKPLGEVFEGTKLVSGATVREDGGVSLIIDIAALFKSRYQG